MGLTIQPKLYYVYLHSRKSDSSIFYIGKGKEKRAWEKYSRNKWWKNVVAKHGFNVKIIKDNLSESCALSLERIIISIEKKVSPLVNLVDGGGGISGWKHSPEAKAKIAAASKGRKISKKSLEALLRYNTGKKLTEEHKLKLSLAKKGKPRAPLSEETKKKISISHMGIRPSPETLRKMSESKKGKNTGKSSPTYDHVIRTFIHPKHGSFDGTRGDIIIKYGLSDSCMSMLINGKRKTVKGWRLI